MSITKIFISICLLNVSDTVATTTSADSVHMATTTSADSPAVAVPPTPPVDASGDKAALVQQLRKSGNAAFAQKNMADAQKFYSEALDLASAHGINDSAHECHKIYSNR